MRKIIYCFVVSICILGVLPVFGAPINVIPYPMKVVQGDGYFMVSPDTKVVFDENLQPVEGFYSEILEIALGVPLTKKKGGKNLIVLRVDKRFGLPEEGYKINITAEKVEIVSSSCKGAFYGIQSLNQLILKDSKTGSVKLPVVMIEDYPRFNWRGCMLDVSRTFMDKKLLMRYIDLMASYKLNVLHLHLIDDQGWRIEIKRYPRLTSVGSKYETEFNEMGGYYTQDEIREIVQYASLRNITIVPEFELPGHECAAIASYPELSCRGIRPKIHPYFMGDQIHKEIFCAGKPEVYDFIYNVLDEILELFPSRYIHIGGDEAPKSEWHKCDYCQKVIRENGLENEEELQSYFVRKIGKYIQEKGRELIGWDEIIDGGKLGGDEIIMYWRGWKAKEVEKVAQQGFRIISSPNIYCYFDYNYESIDTKKVYFYEPIPVGTSDEVAQNYIGVQANFWSHIDRSENRIDQQLFPRLFALSEIAWSRAQNKDWKRFKKIAKIHSEKQRENQVNCYYDKSVYNPD
ncbi:beta-N-acetylhexosaminidase [uncultured Parabacteroides sp.]|uniref:beta-N-acetylhexosaminidase n=1 Tax=uncultured Parabacteroides sp. TaxID=512312 RepID=UPI00260470C4|nr:beta-N-acetylhexosaminidase [uncultured Parabacteroides sp.]